MSDGDDSIEDHSMSVDSHPPLSPTPSFTASDKANVSGSHQLTSLQERDSSNDDYGKVNVTAVVTFREIMFITPFTPRFVTVLIVPAEKLKAKGNCKFHMVKILGNG